MATPPSSPGSPWETPLSHMHWIQTPKTPLRSQSHAYLSTPDVFKQLVRAHDGRDDGSCYGSRTIWNPFEKYYVFEPIYDEDPELLDNYKEMQKRQDYKKGTMKGLEELCSWREDELKYNEVNADAFREKILVPYELELREDEYDSILQSQYSRACLKDWSNRHASRKTKDELSQLYKLRNDMEEQIISRDYLVTAKEEDEYHKCKKLRF